MVSYFKNNELRDEVIFIGWNTYLKYAGQDTIDILSKWVSGYKGRQH